MTWQASVLPLGIYIMVTIKPVRGKKVVFGTFAKAGRAIHSLKTNSCGALAMLQREAMPGLFWCLAALILRSKIKSKSKIKAGI
jgi:hypothetical protein